ncbi:olfactory receptor 1J1-like [Diadema setosum]|uniref:olfactory receptor 1J1-like n=1 Tax=Diadema setosum TaxID=31175 RepID=UPI003B3AC8F8
MLAIQREPTLREPSYFLLACLALTDFLAGLVTIPAEVFSRIFQSYTTCAEATAVYFSIWSYIFTWVSFAVIVLVNVDKYIAKTRPLQYVSLVTSRRVVMVIVGVWLLGMTYGFMYTYGAGEDQSVTGYCTTDSNRRVSKKIHHPITGAFIIASSLVSSVATSGFSPSPNPRRDLEGE